MAVLEARGLGKDYGALRAVEALDLQVEPGEIVGLLGPNGAGKTTAISMLCGVVTPSRGTVRVSGHDLAREPMRARRAIGLVPQDLAIYEELSARQNLRYFGALYGLRGAELTGRIDWALGIAGLSERAGEPVSRYSGGMKRRLNLAAGLLHRPALVILDEPTVGVDPQSRAHIFASIRALVADSGTSVLYTSHYMEEVELLCQRVTILDRGAVIAEGRVEELVARGGGGAVDIELRGDPDAVAAALGELGEVSIEERTEQGGRLRLAGAAKPGAVVRAVEKAGGEVEGLRAHRPSLETVFLAMTGHSLRDEA
ncbi:MAG TPA: ABC transporter ATP-binding protein [Kofleriaceae bacterium]|nr:ABC transporter ATP-binding protein [Kofleriaceae bacterium]